MTVVRVFLESVRQTPLVPVVAIFALALYLGVELHRAAPPVIFAGGIDIAVDDSPAVIGYEELWQHPGPRSAAREHLLVERAETGWLIGNVSSRRRVLARIAGAGSRLVQRWPLRAGDRFSLPEAEFLVREAGADRLVLEDVDNGRLLVWNDGTLEPSGEAVHLVCTSAWSRLIKQARWTFRNVASEGRPEFELFGIGGGLNCSNRWRQPDLPPGAMSVRWLAGRFWLAPGERHGDILLQREGDDRGYGFTDLRLPVDGPEGRVESIILGRTRYRIDTPAGHLRLTPVANMELWSPGDGIEDSRRRRSWAGGGRRAWPWLQDQWLSLMPGAGAALLAIIGLGILHYRQREARWRDLLARGLALAPAAVGGWLTLLLYRGGGAPDAILLIAMVWLSWAWASLMMLVTGRLGGAAGWIWFVASFLAMTGTLVLLQLGAGAENTRWLGFVMKHATLLALFGWIMSAACAIPGVAWQRIWIRLFSTEGIAAAVATLLVVLMMIQLALGSEEGIGGVQPVELTKSAFVFLLAFVGMHFTEIRMRETREYRRSPLVMMLPFLRFVAIFFVVVLSLIVGVRDFSPMIIISLVTLAWLWRLGGPVGGRQGALIWWLPRPLVLVMMAGIVFAGWYAWNNAEALPDNMPQKDRVLVWADPGLHPHSGSQVLGAMDRVGEGGWTGEIAWFGPNGDNMTLPAVQDDFITAFLLNRFGGYAGLVLLLFQMFYLVLLMTLSRRVRRDTENSDFREQTAGLVLGYTIHGLAWMQVAHWTIAWSNTLGLLPVMGQPMTWISAGNSHLVGFALVTLSIALITAWVLETRRRTAAAVD